MKNLAYLIAGVSAAIAYFLIRSQQSGQHGSESLQPVEVLAHELEEAWADHHTRV